jgi:hypothetical protein
LFTLGSQFLIAEVAHKVGVLLATVKVMYALILSKNVLGYILGEFFTNSSGHPSVRPVFLVPGAKFMPGRQFYTYVALGAHRANPDVG